MSSASLDVSSQAASEAQTLPNLTAATDCGSSSRQPGELYPPIEPYNSGWLTVSDIHEIYYEECGNKDGNPIVLLHGGPGSGSGPNSRRYMDPEAYRIILFDQRGAGKSRPLAELKDNTTWDLVSDLEKLREHLGVTKWVVFGGSWGSTLALCYAEKHPDSVKALVIGGVFTLRREELMWVYKEGASYLYPDKWEKFLEPIPEVERGDMLSAYHRRFTGDDKDVQMRCVKAWTEWELSMFGLVPDPAAVQSKLTDEKWMLTKALIESHYFIHGGWLPENSYILDNVDKIRHIPATIIQGRYDVTTPMRTAWELHKRWPEAELYVIPDGGHSPSDLGRMNGLIDATDKYRTV